jgi:hypothetical protein
MKKLFKLLEFLLIMIVAVGGGMIITLICRESFWVSVLLPIALIEVIWLKSENNAYN